LDFSLVSNKNLTKVLTSSTLGSGPDEVGQKASEYSPYNVTYKKKISKPKNVFSLRTRRLAKRNQGKRYTVTYTCENCLFQDGITLGAKVLTRWPT